MCMPKSRNRVFSVVRVVGFLERQPTARDGHSPFGATAPGNAPYWVSFRPIRHATVRLPEERGILAGTDEFGKSTLTAPQAGHYTDAT